MASPVPVDVSKLFAYLQKGEYKSFKTQSKAHPTAGPHIEVGNNVKVFFSDALAKSLAGDYTDHPQGAAAVKEMFSKTTGKLEGWSVAVKTDKNSDQGKGWFWVEFTSTTDSSKVAVPAGNGVPLCAGCHQTGRDFVLSKLPE